MKLDILIVDFILIAAVALPYLLFIFIGHKEEAKLKNKFSEEAIKNGLQFQEKDNWNNNIIGFDKENAKIFLCQKRKAEIITEIIDLKQVRTCSIVEEIQTVKINNRTENILQKLDLQLSLHDGSFQIVNLYNCEETYSQDYERKYADRWNHTINAFLIYRPTVHSAA